MATDKVRLRSRFAERDANTTAITSLGDIKLDASGLSEQEFSREEVQQLIDIPNGVWTIDGEERPILTEKVPATPIVTPSAADAEKAAANEVKKFNSTLKKELTAMDLEMLKDRAVLEGLSGETLTSAIEAGEETLRSFIFEQTKK